jgi:hypothetical protein
VTIAVKKWVAINRTGGTDGNITVKGEGRVRLIVAGEDELTDSVTGTRNDADILIGKGSGTHIPNETARRLQILAPRDTTILMGGSAGDPAVFDGVIYAPGGKTGTGLTYLKQGHLYGAVITGNLTLGQSGQVHFDKSLNDRPLPLSTRVSRLEYLHVATHRVNVSGQ